MPKYEYDEKLPFVVVDSNGGVIARFAARHLAEEYAFDYNRYFVDTQEPWGYPFLIWGEK